VAPDGTSTSANLSALNEGDWGYLTYPKDFPGAQQNYPAGAYTVIWTKALSGEFLACDGWLAG
jgi:hypothetical protein